MQQTYAFWPSRSRSLLVLAVWFVFAFVVGAAGLLAVAPLPPPAVAFGLTACTLLVLRTSPAARAGARALGLRALVAFHLVRLAAGAYFLVLYGRGVLPAEFALAAGWGDIAVALTALPVLWLCLPVRTEGQRLGLLAWNVLGLVDILGVLGNGVRLFVQDPALAAPFSTLPLALLPTFVVPLVIVSHVLIFAWTPNPAVRSL